MSENAEKSIEEMVTSNNPEERRLALKMLTGESNVATNTDVTEENATEEATPNVDNLANPVETVPIDTQKIKVVYRGQEIIRDDPDGYLGRKDINGLKIAKAHADAHIEYLEKANEEAMRKLAELEALKKEIEKKPEQPIKKEEEPKTYNVKEKPVLPELQNSDPSYWTPEESEAMIEYWKKMDEYVSNNLNEPPAIKELKEEIDRLKKEQESRFSEIDKVKKKSIEEAEEAKYWNELETFRNVHSEYKKVDKSIKDLNQEVEKWANDLIEAAGYKLPYNPSVVDVHKFEQTKLELMDKYRNGDSAVHSLGVNAPEGYEEVFNLVTLENEKARLIKEGVLGQRASMHDVWLYLQDRTGQFDTSLTKLEAEARKKGANDILNIAQKKQSENAIVLPDNAMGKKVETDLSNISIEKVRQVMGAHPIELQRNPELRALKELIMKNI